ncbi:MAG TPA: efflux RND transporter periplasmic adaptor subunit [Candidatus Woesebacteria bacterium]|nr:efflux RND transporter periplasmic adaptor subunit [Candidatus Woesebacteria bacterium]HNS95229.1 efflux RND transporter periplasmic adaptor subunit [Candidatus Woesebacteria bacterium]
MTKRKLIILFGILALISGIGYYMYSQNSASAQLGKGISDGETFTVAKSTLKETLTISGQIDAEEKVTLTFPTGGKLYWVGVKEGDYVEKYQGIASLDQRDLEKRLETSLNNFMISRWDFDQVKSDNKDAPYKDGELGDRMKRIIDKAQFGLNNAVVAVELQALAREYAYLYTPIEGVVTKVGAPYAGVTVSAQTVYEVINPNTIYFSAFADQTEVPDLRVGQSAKIIIDAYPDSTVNATIRSIAYAPRAGDVSTNYEVKLALSNSIDVNAYRLGMTGDVEFVTKQKQNVYAIPSSYILTEEGKKYVFVLQDGKPKKQEVKIGDEADTEVEIVKGISGGDILAEPSR